MRRRQAWCHFLILFQLKWAFAWHNQPFCIVSYIFYFLLSFTSQQSHLSNEGQAWLKVQDDHPSFTPHVSGCKHHLFLFLFPMSPPPCVTVLVCHSLFHLLISHSTFHQLLVSPNGCHDDVQGLRTFHLTPCKCGSLKWRVVKVTVFGVKMLHLTPFSEASWQVDVHNVLRRRSWMYNGILWKTQGSWCYTVEVSWDKVLNMINNLRKMIPSRCTCLYK